MKKESEKETLMLKPEKINRNNLPITEHSNGQQRDQAKQRSNTFENK